MCTFFFELESFTKSDTVNFEFSLIFFVSKSELIKSVLRITFFTFFLDLKPCLGILI